MRISDHQSWYKFVAYNTQTLYGYGTAEEADQFSDQLNASRVINHYAAHALDEATATELKLEDNTEAFNIGDELQGRQT